ncbi:MAG: hypothetical protein ACREOZ_02665 [Gloeomargaritales cyanobacterium]
MLQEIEKLRREICAKDEGVNRLKNGCLQRVSGNTQRPPLHPAMCSMRKYLKLNDEMMIRSVSCAGSGFLTFYLTHIWRVLSVTAAGKTKTQNRQQSD